jgi:thiol-disulfide isomerase/thioredoxin
MTPKTAFPCAIMVAATLAVMAALVPAPAAAADVVCRANYDFCVEVNGAYPPDARFFVAETRGKFLVDIPSQSKSVLIDLPTRRAVSVPRASIKPDGADGVVRIADPGLAGTPAYALSIEGPVLRFQADAAKVRVLKVTEREPQVGPITLEALAADRPEYREGMKAYRPDPVAIEALKKNKKAIEIEAYFGTWCAHCKIYMPKFLRVMQDAANPNIKLTLVGVPKNWGDGKMPGPWQGKNFQNVPAIMILYEGRELTRMSAHEGAVPEVDLATLLSAIK